MGHHFHLNDHVLLHRGCDHGRDRVHVHGDDPQVHKPVYCRQHDMSKTRKDVKAVKLTQC